MTKREKLIVSAYTGDLMVNFDELHVFIEEVLGRSIFTHELARPEILSELRNALRDDFLKLCEEDTPE